MAPSPSFPPIGQWPSFIVSPVSFVSVCIKNWEIYAANPQESTKWKTNAKARNDGLNHLLIYLGAYS